MEQTEDFIPTEDFVPIPTELGFWHPDVGYWQTIGGITPEILASYPEGTVNVPLIPGSGNEWEWNGTEWVAKEVVPPTYTDGEIQQMRAKAYRNESDPIFFQWQRGEATEEQWLAKIQEIKTRYPYNAETE